MLNISESDLIEVVTGYPFDLGTQNKDYHDKHQRELVWKSIQDKFGPATVGFNIKEMGDRKRRPRISPYMDAKRWCLSGKDKDGFTKRFVNSEIGFGLFTTKNFQKGDFLMEYQGDNNEATEDDGDDVEYVFYYKRNNIQYRIDASEPSSSGMARYMNDEKTHPNCVAKKQIFIDDSVENGATIEHVHICFFALHDIVENTELRYDYGTENLPWRQRDRAGSTTGIKAEAVITPTVEEADELIKLVQLHLQLQRALTINPDALTIENPEHGINKCISIMQNMENINYTYEVFTDSRCVSCIDSIKKLRRYTHSESIRAKANHLFKYFREVYKQVYKPNAQSNAGEETNSHQSSADLSYDRSAEESDDDRSPESSDSGPEESSDSGVEESADSDVDDDRRPNEPDSGRIVEQLDDDTIPEKSSDARSSGEPDFGSREVPDNRRQKEKDDDRSSIAEQEEYHRKRASRDNAFPSTSGMSLCTAGGQATATETLSDPTPNGSSGVVTLAPSRRPKNIFPIGDTVEMCAAVDDSKTVIDTVETYTSIPQNTDSGQATATETLSEPTLNPIGDTVETYTAIPKNMESGQPTATETLSEPTTSDNSEVVTLASSHSPEFTFPIGDTVETYTAITQNTEDGRTTATETSSEPIQSFNSEEVTLASSRSPKATFPIGDTIETYAAVDGPKTATDKVETYTAIPKITDSGQPTPTETLSEPTLNPIGDTVGTYTAIPKNMDSGQPTATETLSEPTTSDNSEEVRLASSRSPKATVPIGDTIETYAAVDGPKTATDKVETYTAIPKITDSGQPTATETLSEPTLNPIGDTVGTYTAIPKNMDSGQPTATETLSEPTTSDNSEEVRLASSRSPKATVPIGDTIETYAAVDGPKTATDKVETYTAIPKITDSGQPTATETLSEPTLNPIGDTVGTYTAIPKNMDSGQPTATETLSEPTTSDNSEVATLASSHSPESTSPIWDTLETFAAVTQNTDSGQAIATETWSKPTPSGNSGEVMLASNHSPKSTFPIGDRVETNAAVNHGSKTANDTVETYTAIPQNTDSGQPTATETLSEPTSDNSEVVTLASSHSPESTFSIGDTVETYAAVDSSKTVTDTLTVTVEGFICGYCGKAYRTQVEMYECKIWHLETELTELNTRRIQTLTVDIPVEVEEETALSDTQTNAEEDAPSEDDRGSKRQKTSGSGKNQMNSNDRRHKDRGRMLHSDEEAPSEDDRGRKRQKTSGSWKNRMNSNDRRHKDRGRMLHSDEEAPSEDDRGRKRQKTSGSWKNRMNSNDRRHKDRGRMLHSDEEAPSKNPVEAISPRSTKFPEIKVSTFKVKDDGKRQYGKQACVYCHKLIFKVARHMITASGHSDKPEVAKILSKAKKEQQMEFEKLRLFGNYRHNMRVYDKREGTLLVLRRSVNEKIAEDYVPCLHCLGFVEEKGLWHHVKHCKFKPLGYKDEDEEPTHGSSIVARSRMLLQGSLTTYKADHCDYKHFKDVVLKNMRGGEVKQRVKSDDLILSYGTALLERAGEGRRHHISTKVRQLGRLVNEVAKMDENVDLMYCIDPQNFDKVVEATKILSGTVKQKTASGVSMTKTPSFGLQVGHSLRKASMVKLGRAIRLKDQQMRSEAQDFDLLFSAEWTDKISSPALQTLKERKYYSEEEIPDTDDLVKFNKYANEKMQMGTKNLHQQPSTTNWQDLARAVYCAATVFNLRRGGEVVKMPLSCYVNRPATDTPVNKELLKSLSTLERKLLTRFDVLDISGKRTRKVPILIKREWEQAMQLLVKKREDCGVRQCNPYFFAGTGKFYMNPWKMIHDTAIEAGCDQPGRISTTRLRKYCATVVQVLELRDGELEWLSNHMGHSIDVHKDTYRLHEHAIEISKVSRILLAIESGNVATWKGKSLCDIGVSDIPVEVDEEDQIDEEETSLSDAETDADSDIAFVKRKKCLQLPYDSSDSSEVDEPKRKKCRMVLNDGAGIKQKRRWSLKELDVFNKNMTKYIEKEIMPPRTALDRVVEQLSNSRTVAQVRTRSNNLIKIKRSKHQNQSKQPDKD